MHALALSRNSTNVRNLVRLAWQRLDLAVKAALAPDRAVEKAARLFATPPRFAHSERELGLLAGGTRLAVRAPDAALAAWRFGHADRPAVLLSHGWGGRGTQLRAFVAPLVEAGYQAVLFDHVGHGHSEGEEATLVHFSNDLEAVAREVESRGAAVAGVVGHSLGAAAAGAWLNHTGRELRAVLVASPTSVQRYSNHFARRLGISEPVRRAMQERFERRLGRRWAEFELPQAVANVKARALVIHDAADREVGFAAALALARAWPDARLVRTDGLGHRRILRDPGVVRDAVDFIAGRVVFAPPPAKGAAAFGAPAPLV